MKPDSHVFTNYCMSQSWQIVIKFKVSSKKLKRASKSELLIKKN